MNPTERFGPTRRGGPIFRWLGEPLAIDLANTVMVVREDETLDLLDSPERLDQWLAAQSDRLDPSLLNGVDVDSLRSLRDAIRELFDAAAHDEALSPAALIVLNAASAAAPIAPQLEQAGAAAPATSHLEADREPSARLCAAIARSAIELLSDSGSGRPKLCTAPSCGMFFLGARRWCCTACGNRARVARHYNRTREQGARRTPANATGE
jgi:predicted RNA-binding Zn ribbon-like protein